MAIPSGLRVETEAAFDLARGWRFTLGERRARFVAPASRASEKRPRSRRQSRTRARAGR